MDEMFIHRNAWKVMKILTKKMVIRVILMSTYMYRLMSRRGQSHGLTFKPGLSYYDSVKQLHKSHWASCS